MSDEHHVRELPPGDEAHFTASYQHLADLGLAPEIIEFTDRLLVTRRHKTLREWLADDPSSDETDDMVVRIVECLRAVHASGVCHRDVHVDNILLTDEMRPLLIDPHFMIESEPDRPCYDLVGPEASGVAVPVQHVAQGGVAALGVWWDAPVEVRELGPCLGLVERFL